MTHLQTTRSLKRIGICFLRQAVLLMMTIAPLFFNSGCSSQPPSQVIIYSLNGYSLNGESKGNLEFSGEKFSGYEVYGKVEVLDEQTKSKIADLIRFDINNPKTPNKCFWPRHAVVIVVNGIKTEYLICYECNAYTINSKSMSAAFGNKSKAILDEQFVKAGIRQDKQKDMN